MMQELAETQIIWWSRDRDLPKPGDTVRAQEGRGRGIEYCFRISHMYFGTMECNRHVQNHESSATLSHFVYLTAINIFNLL